MCRCPSLGDGLGSGLGVDVSRSGYVDDDYDQWAMIRWRGAVASAIRGRRGQDFLKEMLAALDALPRKALIADDLERGGEVCAIGSVGKARGLDMSTTDPEDYEAVARLFGIPRALAQEIEFMNDEAFWKATDEDRFIKVRDWVRSQVRAEEPQS